MKGGDELTMIFESTRRSLEVRAGGQQALDFRSKCRIILQARFEFGLPCLVILLVRCLDLGMIGVQVRLALVGVGWTMGLIHRRHRAVPHAFALGVGNHTTQIQNDAQRKKKCN